MEYSSLKKNQVQHDAVIGNGIYRDHFPWWDFINIADF